MDIIEKTCREKGVRMTAQRRIIASVLLNAEDHPDVDELYRRACNVDPRISLATVYRTVRILEDLGVVSRTSIGGRSRWEVMPKTHHDHLIDIETGCVIEFRNEEIERLQELAAQELGYSLVAHRLELFGKPLKTKKSRN